MDENLVTAAIKLREGGNEGFEDFYKLTVKYVYSIAYAYLLSKEDAEDVVEDTYLKVYSIRKKLDPSKNILGFIKRIATNYSLKKLNKRRRAYSRFPSNCLCETEDKRDYTEITEALQRLDTLDRAVLTMYYFDNCPINEISFLLGKSVSSVKVRLHRARERLKEVLENGEI